MSASYYRARYYDTSVGRFLREDPLRFTAGTNFHVYVGNHPVAQADPYGLWPSWGDIWKWGKDKFDKGRETWKKGTEYADKISCVGTYANCYLSTFSNLDSLSQAKQGMPRPTQDELEHPTENLEFSQDLRQAKDCIAGNDNCKKQLEDCLKGVFSFGILPH